MDVTEIENGLKWRETMKPQAGSLRNQQNKKPLPRLWKEPEKIHITY